MTSLRHNDAVDAEQRRRRLPRRRPRLHPRRRLAAYDADRGRPPRRGLPDDDLPRLARHAAAARRPDDPRVGRRRRRAARGRRRAATAERLVGRRSPATVARAARQRAVRAGSSSVDPELLLPYLLDRRGRTPGRAARAARRRASRAGQRRRRGPRRATRRRSPAPLLLAAHGFVAVGPHDGRRRGRRPRPRSTPSCATCVEQVPRAVSDAPRLTAVTPAPRELAEATDGRAVDLLVVGLGVTGAGVALDAATRGLSVLAVDAHDLAFGTSRWSLQARARRAALPRPRARSAWPTRARSSAAS